MSRSVLTAAILDDEPFARQRLRRLLGKVAGHAIRVVAECADVDELLQHARGEHIDVLFLDIELPGGDGFSALRRWNGPLPRVVFVTAYEQHGVRAFEDRAIDYLLKPLSADRLRETVSRLQERGPLEQGLATPTTPAQGTCGHSAGRRLPLQIGRRTWMVHEAEIQVVRAQGNYLDVETLRGTFTLRRPLNEFVRTLDAAGFLRVHRSAVVRVAAVTEVASAGSGRYRLLLDCGRGVVSGRQYRQAVLACFVPTGEAAAAADEC